MVASDSRWFTSLIGKYSSLDPLVKLLHNNKVSPDLLARRRLWPESQCDNYFILSIKPSKTTRWILGWSHTPYRLPDVRFLAYESLLMTLLSSKKGSTADSADCHPSNTHHPTHQLRQTHPTSHHHTPYSRPAYTS